MGHSAHGRVAALEKGEAITCELRLAAFVDENWRMTQRLSDRAHLQRLKVAVH